MKRIKIAQIGIGHDHASAIFDSLLRQADIFEVKGYCVCKDEEERFERKRSSVYARSVRLSLEEILNDPQLDAVTVECDEGNLTRYALMAIEKGLPVHMDKPGSADPEAFAQLIERAEDKKLTMHLGYMYRYNPVILKTLKDIDSGKLGKIYSVEAHMDCFHNETKRQWLEAFPGGMLFYLGCHLVDLIVRIQGVPEEIIPLNSCTGFDGVTAQDYGMAVFKYQGGVSFAKTCAAEPGGFQRRQLVICGEKGTVVINPLERYLKDAADKKDLLTGDRMITKEEAQRDGWHGNILYQETPPFNRYDTMMSAFAAMVRGERENAYSYEYEVALHRILLEACGVKL